MSDHCPMCQSPTEAVETDNGLAALCQILDNKTKDVFDDLAKKHQRLDAVSSAKKGPRPILMFFQTVSDRHTFLKQAKYLRQAGLRFDDNLSRPQQKQRGALSVDFDALQAKGDRPFYRGSTQRYRHVDKTYACHRNQASIAPTAQP